MAGVLEGKKESRRNRIIQSAIVLFDELGYDKTTMEKIAVKSDLGVGTLYNYYTSKNELFFSIIKEGAGKYTEELNSVIDKSVRLETSLYEFYRIYFNSFSTYSKRVWRELFGEIFLKQNNYSKIIDSIDKIFLDKLSELFEQYKSKGVLRAETDSETIIMVIYSILGYNIIRYITDENLTGEQLLNMVTKQSECIIKGLLNED